mgnify:CR=1 FL=1
MNPPQRPAKTPLQLDRELARELCALDHGLSEWEVGFAESICKQTERGVPLTDKQRATAEKILAGK